MTLTADIRAEVEKALAADPGAVLDYIARDTNVTPADVISCLPPEQACTIPGDKFVEVMTEITQWGEITFIVMTDDVVFEARGELPKGSVAHGFYNLHGKPIGGHLKNGNCASISFISRPLFNSDSHSVQFHNHDGGCMFKIYLGRDAERQLIPKQVSLFKAYRDEMASQ